MQAKDEKNQEGGEKRFDEEKGKMGKKQDEKNKKRAEEN